MDVMRTMADYGALQSACLHLAKMGKTRSSVDARALSSITAWDLSLELTADGTGVSCYAQYYSLWQADTAHVSFTVEVEALSTI